jgi:hypothetical protein
MNIGKLLGAAFRAAKKNPTLVIGIVTGAKPALKVAEAIIKPVVKPLLDEVKAELRKPKA